jgi:hypothetical protein
VGEHMEEGRGAERMRSGEGRSKSGRRGFGAERVEANQIGAASRAEGRKAQQSTAEGAKQGTRRVLSGIRGCESVQDRITTEVLASPPSSDLTQASALKALEAANFSNFPGQQQQSSRKQASMTSNQNDRTRSSNSGMSELQTT